MRKQKDNLYKANLLEKLVHKIDKNGSNLQAKKLDKSVQKDKENFEPFEYSLTNWSRSKSIENKYLSS
jgi:hypothetical protein